ncbi:50S ribosomal protein L24 [Phycisphaeraceae bacterium D3-23]
MARHIRTGDEVVVTAGNDKGKRGKVTRVKNDEDRILVSGVNVRRKTVKPTQSNPQGGIITVEMPIHISNVSPVDKKNKATRVRFVTKDDGSKVRVAATTGEELSVLKKAR